MSKELIRKRPALESALGVSRAQEVTEQLEKYVEQLERRIKPYLPAAAPPSTTYTSSARGSTTTKYATVADRYGTSGTSCDSPRKQTKTYLPLFFLDRGQALGLSGGFEFCGAFFRHLDLRRLRRRDGVQLQRKVRDRLRRAFEPSAHCVPRNSKSGHQLIQNNEGGMFSLSSG